MDRNIRKIQLGNEQVDAVPTRIRTSNELWSEFILDDGTLLRVKTVATEVYRVVGRFDPDGNPLYVLRSNNIMVVQANEEMRKK